MTIIRTVEELAEIYGEPVPTSIIKELDRISDDHRQFIAAAPFVIVATLGSRRARLLTERRSGGFRSRRR